MGSFDYSSSVATPLSSINFSITSNHFIQLWIFILKRIRNQESAIVGVLQYNEIWKYLVENKQFAIISLFD